MFKCTFTSTQGTDYQGFFRQIPAEGDPGAIDAVCEGSVVFGECDQDPNATGKPELPKAKWEFTTGPGDTFPLWFCNSCVMKFITKGLRGVHTWTNEATGETIDYTCEPFLAERDGIADDDANYVFGDLLVRASGGMDPAEVWTPGTAYSETDITSYAPDA